MLHENNLLFALHYFVRFQETLTAFKAICSIKSLIKQLRYQIQIEKIWSQIKSGMQGNDKKAERLAKTRERRRQRLLEETAEEREARLAKRREGTDIMVIYSNLTWQHTNEKAHQAAKSCDDFTRNFSSFTIRTCIANTALILQYLNK
jgi:hypothetical protein